MAVSGAASEKKIKLQKKPFATSVTFEYNRVFILVDQQRFNKFFEDKFESQSEPKPFKEALTLSKKANAVLQIDSIVVYFREFLERELDKGNVQIFYGARKIQARYIRREDITMEKENLEAKRYYVEEFKEPFHIKSSDNPVTD
jgi:hypothetical protein